MTGKLRWQDGITAVLGVVLFITPFAFGETSQTAAAWTAYVGGVLLFVFGVGSLLFRWDPTVEFLPLIDGAFVFLAPWVLGFSGITQWPGAPGSLAFWHLSAQGRPCSWAA